MLRLVQFLMIAFILVDASASKAQATISFKGKELGEHRVINGVSLHSGIEGELRTYHATVVKSIEAPFDFIVDKILRFQDRCNNEYKDKRVNLAKDFVCPYHNDNLVESVPIREFKASAPAMEADLKDRFILWRNIYNREDFNYYDMVEVREISRVKGKREYKITYRMLNDDEVAKFLDEPKKKNSAFNHVEGGYLVKEEEQVKTRVELMYATQTDHWLLNSGLAVSVVMKNVAKGTNNTLDQLTQAVLKSN
jgi:hypothetical protein